MDGQPNGIKSVIYVESVGYSLTYAWRARMTIYLYSNICMQMTDSLLPFEIIIDLNDRFSVSRTSCFLIDERNFEAWDHLHFTVKHKRKSLQEFSQKRFLFLKVLSTSIPTLIFSKSGIEQQLVLICKCCALKKIE